MATAYETFIANTSKTAYSSLWDMDKIIGTGSGSFTATAPTAISTPTTSTMAYATTIGANYYFQGIYSIDSGASWNDFGSQVPNLTTPGSPVFQTIDVVGIVGSAGTFTVAAFNYWDLVHGTGSAKTVMWKAIFFSKNEQGAINPQLIADPTLFTSVARNYQKVAIKDKVAFNVTSGVGKTAVVNHDLGYIPMVRAFYVAATPSVRVDGLWAGYRIATQITATTVSFVLDANYSVNTATGFIEYKVYYDS